MTTQGTADNRQWEKTARLLVLNNLPSLLVMKDTIVKIVNNIVGNIHDEKFRVLKMTNSALQQKILNCHGGQEMLLCLGFTVCTQAETGAKNLELNLVDSSDDEECDMIVELLRSGLRWLQDTCATCELYATAGNSINGKNSKIGGIRAPASTSSARAPSSTAGGVGLAEGSCCEVIAQIKLPTGRVVSGGFMYSDLIGDVRRYASCYFAPDRAGDMCISFGHEVKPISDSVLQQNTFRQLGLSSRELFVAHNYRDESTAAERMDATRVRKEEALRAQSVVKQVQQKKTLNLNVARQSEKAHILSVFKGDRDDMKERQAYTQSLSLQEQQQQQVEECNNNNNNNNNNGEEN